MSRRPALATLLEHYNVEAGWHATPQDAQRTILNSLATVCLPLPGRGARFNSDTFQIDWTWCPT